MELGGKKRYGGSGRLMEPGKLRPHESGLEALVCWKTKRSLERSILKYSTRGGSNIFQLFDTSERQDHFVANRKRWLESQGKNVAQQESWQNEWHDIEYQGVMAKAPPCPERTLKTPLPQQSSHSSREEEGQWVAMEDRRRQEYRFREDGEENAEIP